MGKKISQVTATIISVGKAMPLIGGGLVGIFGAAPGNSSPYSALRNGRPFHEFVDSVACNYTWYSTIYSNFKEDRGVGTKGLLAGLIVHKLIGWIAE